MRVILFIAILFSLTGLGWPQTIHADSNPNVDVYILIDASGTMKSAEQKAISRLEAAFELLDPKTLVSVTFFGGKLEDSGGSSTCDDTVFISASNPKEDGIPRFPNLGGREGETSIGNAILAALRHGGDEARIVVITDGIEECSSDFVGIRTEFPMASIDIIQVGDRQNTALDLLEIQPRRTLQTQSLPVPFPVQIVGQEIKPDERHSLIIFFEKWLWLFAFVAIYILSFWLGWSNQNRAIKLEAETEEIRSLERASLIDGNDEAQSKLTETLKKIQDVRNNADQQRKDWSKLKKGRSKIWSWLSRPWQITGLLLIALFLFWVAATPDKFMFSLIEIGNVRQSAWSVLDSDFATAFAVIWIVSLFYSGMQFQRRKEAETNFSIVSQEAQWKEDIENQKAIEETKRELQAELSRVRRSVKRMKFGSWHTYISDSSRVDELVSYELSNLFKGIHDDAKDRAIETEETGENGYLDEIERLKAYTSVRTISSSGFGSSKRDFGAFLNALLADKVVAPSLSDGWNRLAAAISDSDLDSFLETLKTLDLEES